MDEPPPQYLNAASMPALAAVFPMGRRLKATGPGLWCCISPNMAIACMFRQFYGCAILKLTQQYNGHENVCALAKAHRATSGTMKFCEERPDSSEYCVWKLRATIGRQDHHWIEVKLEKMEGASKGRPLPCHTILSSNPVAGWDFGHCCSPNDRPGTVAPKRAIAIWAAASFTPSFAREISRKTRNALA